MNEETLKTVAIIGRPNVGKSTLFNRLVGKRIAIETPIAGTTRDRIFSEASWQGNKFILLDVAGIETGSKSEIDKSIQEGVELAIDEADLVLFLVDWTEKDNAMDKIIASKLRRSKKPAILVVNKADNITRQKDMLEFSRMGDFDMIGVSAISGSNTGDLLDLIIKKLQTVKIQESGKKGKEDFDINLAIIGRPNVGKSTLLNTIIGEKRAIVSGEAGTTRDVINVMFSHKGKKIMIADTAGIRRPGKVSKGSIEGFSLLRTEQALKNSDIAILVIDALEGLVALDTNILGKAKEWGKGVILAINKIDQIEDIDDYQAQTLSILRNKLNFVPWLPVVFISAENNQNLKAVLDQVITVDNNRHTEIDQETLDQILEEAKEANSQLFGLKRLTQKRTAPPIFEITFKGKEPHYTQIRYLENTIRDHFPMNGSPIFLDLTSRNRT